MEILTNTQIRSIKNKHDMELVELNNYRKVLGLQWQLSTNKIVCELLPICEYDQLLRSKMYRKRLVCYTIR